MLDGMDRYFRAEAQLREWVAAAMAAGEADFRLVVKVKDGEVTAELTQHLHV
jgi:uncharacterized protein YegJ (DUF2314 family)